MKVTGCEIIRYEWITPGTNLEISLMVGLKFFNVPLRHNFLSIFLSLYSQRVKKPHQRTLPSLFYTKLRLNHSDWFGDMK